MNSLAFRLLSACDFQSLDTKPSFDDLLAVGLWVKHLLWSHALHICKVESTAPPHFQDT